MSIVDIRVRLVSAWQLRGVSRAENVGFGGIFGDNGSRGGRVRSGADEVDILVSGTISGLIGGGVLAIGTED